MSTYCLGWAGKPISRGTRSTLLNFRERAGTGAFIAIPLDFRKTHPYRDLRLILYTDPFFGILTLNAPEANLKLANVCSRLTRVAKPSSGSGSLGLSAGNSLVRSTDCDGVKPNQIFHNPVWFVDFKVLNTPR